MSDRPSLVDRLLAFRDRTLSRPAFQRRAMGIWPVSRHARAEARALFDLTAGFAYSQVLAACLKLGLFRRLADAPATPDVLGPEIGLPPEETRRLLSAAASLRLLSRRSGGRYGLGALGAALLGQPGVQAMIAHHAALYEDLADPVALLKSGGPGERLGRYWAYATTEKPDAIGPEAAGEYTALMAASQAFIAEEVLAAFDFSRFNRLMDVGGGSGAFLSAVGARHPDLALVLFDLPAVAHHARAAKCDGRLPARIEIVGGSFDDPALPAGADLASLVRILHDHPDERVDLVLSKVREALTPGGTLVVAEPMAGTPGAERIEAYFAMFLIAMGSGRLRTRAELEERLKRAGFSDIREHGTRNPLLVRVLSAKRPG